MVSTLGTASRELAQASVSGSTDTATRGVTAQTVAVNPLGTPEQLAAEQRAAETVNTLPVQLMKLVLQFGWRATAQQQFKLVGGPDEENLDALNEAVNEYAMGAAFQQQLLNPMTPTAVMQVAPRTFGTGRTSAAHASSTTIRTPSTASWRSTGRRRM
jgi:hypothetical protein